MMSAPGACGLRIATTANTCAAEPDGQIDVGFDRNCARPHLSARENHMHIKANFSSRLNPIPPVQSRHEKYSAFALSEIDVPWARPAID
jgi:hypothetical protein